MTPRLTIHARQRCAEMGVSTKVAKRILLDPRRVTYAQPFDSKGKPYAEAAMIALAPCEPDYAVVFAPGEPDRVLTVLYNTREEFTR